MRGDISCQSGPLKLDIELLETEERVGSVRANIRLSYTGRRQQVHWTAGDVWLEYRSLSAFQAQLSSLEEARLIDASDYPLLRITREARTEVVEVNPKEERQSGDGASARVTFFVDSGFMAAVEAAFMEFPRWW